MCRYAVTEYKNHFVCFECRKGFKKIALLDYLQKKGLDLAYKELRVATSGKLKAQYEKKHDITYKQLLDLYYENVSGCPECGTTMWPMGYDFRVPKRSDKNQWIVIEHLARHGFAFQGCGCGVGYKPPANPSELSQWLKEHERETESQKLLRRSSKPA